MAVKRKEMWLVLLLLGGAGAALALRRSDGTITPSSPGGVPPSSGNGEGTTPAGNGEAPPADGTDGTTPVRYTPGQEQTKQFVDLTETLK
jgi:hypothetical protein